MVKARKETTKEAEIKNQLEAIGIYNRFYYVASHNRVEPCTFRKESSVFPVHTCETAPVVDVHGVFSTGAGGKRVFKLRDFMCFDDAPTAVTLSEPVNVVATPRSDGPFFLTMTHAITSTGLTDVEITVFAWNADGKPAPDVYFDWRCRAHIYP